MPRSLNIAPEIISSFMLARESRLSFVSLREAKDLCHLRPIAQLLRSSQGAPSG